MELEMDFNFSHKKVVCLENEYDKRDKMYKLLWGAMLFKMLIRTKQINGRLTTQKEKQRKKQVLNEELNIYYPYVRDDTFFHLGPGNTQSIFWSPLLTRGAAKGSRVFCSQVEVLFC